VELRNKQRILTFLGKILVNEIAPRPHNSGHYTIEACAISQFEAHLRAILDLPLSAEDLEVDRASVMLNILGGGGPQDHLRVAKEALNVRRAAVHLYGKGDGRPGRKMGHITVTARTLVEAEKNMQPLINLVDQIRAERLAPRSTANTVSLPVAPVSKRQPLVAITMGSDSDKNVLLPGAKLLTEFGIEYVSDITSAHRTPARMFKFAEEAASKGIKVIIAAAGGAAHLPGMIAAITRLPVIGVPVKASRLDGLDSLLSIVQMPVS
jgi:phosphoribosylaminoimidazole carboxylase